MLLQWNLLSWKAAVGKNNFVEIVSKKTKCFDFRRRQDWRLEKKRLAAFINRRSHKIVLGQVFLIGINRGTDNRTIETRAKTAKLQKNCIKISFAKLPDTQGMKISSQRFESQHRQHFSPIESLL